MFRDIPQLGITIAAETLQRFWPMVGHYHEQVWNAAEFARSLGTAENAARRYLDILSGACMVRVLPSWFENLKKRQVIKVHQGEIDPCLSPLKIRDWNICGSFIPVIRNTPLKVKAIPSFTPILQTKENFILDKFGRYIIV